MAAKYSDFYSGPRRENWTNYGGNMRTLPFLSVLVLLSGLAVGSPALAQQGKAAGNGDPHRSALTVPVTGTGFEGTFTFERFAPTQTGVVAVGLLKGVVTNPSTLAKSTVVKNIAWPVVQSNAIVNASSRLNPPAMEGGGAAGLLRVSNMQVNMMKVQASCDILNLVLGPLHLDLLGLVVDLNQVVLNITGQTGAGNLLGNLLCGITGILDSPSPTLSQLIQLAGLLNQLLGILGL